MANPLDIGRMILGKAEGRDRAAIMDYLKTGGVNLDPATTAWCAAFVNSTLEQAGFSGTGSNMARSFMDWGNAVEGQPQPGDIGVWPRGNDPTLGHVGFVESVDPKTGMVNLLAGNQGDAVSSKQYSLNDALGFRRGEQANAGLELGPLDPLGSLGTRSAASSQQAPQSISGIGSPGTYAQTKVRDPAPTDVSNPISGYGGGPQGPGAPADGKYKPPEESGWEKFKNNLGESFGDMAGMSSSMPAAAPAAAAPPPGLAATAGVTYEGGDEEKAMRRQRLAEVMAKLNSGASGMPKLWG